MPLSPLAQDALPLASSLTGQVSDEEAVRFMRKNKELKVKTVEEVAEGPSGLFTETMRTLTGAE